MHSHFGLIESSIYTVRFAQNRVWNHWNQQYRDRFAHFRRIHLCFRYSGFVLNYFLNIFSTCEIVTRESVCLHSTFLLECLNPFLDSFWRQPSSPSQDFEQCAHMSFSWYYNNRIWFWYVFVFAWMITLVLDITTSIGMVYCFIHIEYRTIMVFEKLLSINFATKCFICVINTW